MANLAHPSEIRWLNEVYQPGARQLTLRAVLMGMVLGAVLCLSNLYVVLKTGWSLGVTVTACILAFALFRGLKAMHLTRADFTVLENNAMGSVASAAGYMTGGGNMAAIPALLILTGIQPATGWLIVWFGCIAALGVFAAIPIKRQLINIEQIPFPTGIATAETLRSLHGHGTGAEKARMLGWAAVIGAAVAWFRDAKASWMLWNLPAHFGFPLAWGGQMAATWTVSFEGSLLLMGGGAIMSFKTGWSMLLGAIAIYGFIAPAMVEVGAIATISYKGIVQWTLWPAAAMLVASGLLSFALEWRSVARSFAGLGAVFSRRTARGEDALADVECPGWWFPAGFAVLSPVVVFLMWYLFAIPWWAGLMAIPLSVIMGFVAARVTGETDVTPTKALGPVTQLIYGVAVPGQLGPNIMGANVTGGVGLHAADLLTDLKSGYLVGANPRQQVYAQLFGVVAGALAVVPVYNLLIPDASYLMTPQFPAPAVVVWSGVSKALVDGIAGLHPTARLAVLIGAALGIVLTLAERFAPARVKPFVPSATGIGVAAIMPAFNALSFFIGAVVAETLRRKRAAFAERTVVPVASGFIAGESLMGILVAIFIALGWLTK